MSRRCSRLRNTGTVLSLWQDSARAPRALIGGEGVRVVIGSRSGAKNFRKGAAVLREAGIEVTEDFLGERCDEINPVFFHYITTGQPYVALKYAMTADGKIALTRKSHSGSQGRKQGTMCTGAPFLQRRLWQGSVSLADDPMLNRRLENGRSPVRIV